MKICFHCYVDGDRSVGHAELPGHGVAKLLSPLRGRTLGTAELSHSLPAPGSTGIVRR